MSTTKPHPFIPRFKKTLVRNTEIPIKSSLESSQKTNNTIKKANTTSALESKIVELESKCVEFGLDKPKLHSSLTLQKYTQEVKTAKAPTLRPEDLDDNTKNIVNKNVTKQLNFSLHSSMYKNLEKL